MHLPNRNPMRPGLTHHTDIPHPRNTRPPTSRVRRASDRYALDSDSHNTPLTCSDETAEAHLKAMLRRRLLILVCVSVPGQVRSRGFFDLRERRLGVALGTLEIETRVLGQAL